jgi:hypothetical protein
MATRLSRSFLKGILASLGFIGAIAFASTFNLFSPASGILVGNPNTYVTTAATWTNVQSILTGTCNTTTFVRGDGDCATVPTGVSGANPTGTVGLSVVNGSATTYMRSDAAPPLSQTISPTMTGLWIFSGATSAAPVVFENGSAGGGLIETFNSSNGTNLKCWLERIGSTGSWSLDTCTDSGTDSDNAIAITRTTIAVTSLLFGQTTDNPSFQFLGTGEITASGCTVIGGATGGCKGNGTLNAIGLYVGGVAVGTGGGTPGGTSGQVQYNNGGAFGGSGITYSSSSGDVTIGAPSTGVALQVTAVANSEAELLIGSSTSGQSFGELINAGSTSADYAILIQNQAATTNFFKINGDGSGLLGRNGSNNLSWTNTGNFTFNAPSSGGALTIDGAASSSALTVAGSSSSGQSFGITITAGTTSADYALRVLNQSDSTAFLEIYGDGGVTVGAPTGGDKGGGTVNVSSGFYVNNVLLNSGATSQIARTGAICTGSGCTATNASGVSTSITRNSAGNYTVTFSPAFSAQPACNVTADGTAGGIGTFSFGGTSSGTVIMYVGTTPTDESFSLICTG